MCNNPAGFQPSYLRYLLGVCRDHLPFGEVPIKFYMQKRDSGSPKPKRLSADGVEMVDEEELIEPIEDDDFMDDEMMDGEGGQLIDDEMEESESVDDDKIYD
jgi:GTP-binding protein